LTLGYADTSAFAVDFARGHSAVLTPVSGRLVRFQLPSVMATDGSTPGAGPNVDEAVFSRAAGMSGDRVSATLYDREGTLWVGTPTGIDRFRETKLTPITWPRPVSFPGVAPDTNGVVWVAARNAAPAALFVIGARIVTPPNAPGTLTCIYRDLRGGMWFGGEYKLWTRRNGALVPVPLPPRSSQASPGSLPVHAIARDLEDRLWVSVAADGVYRQSTRGEWERFGARQGLGGVAATAITTDSAGRTWLGYASGDVALVVHDSVRVFTAADGLRAGSVLAISVRGDHAWIAGALGVNAFRLGELTRGGKAFVPFHPVNEPLLGISGVVETSDGELWLNGAAGVTRIAAQDVRRALVDTTYRVEYERLDYHDGIEPPAPQIRPLPSAVEGTDGRLWFSSAGGVSWIDPRRVRRNGVPPAVLLRGVRAGGDQYQTGEGNAAIKLPPRTGALSVAYTAYSLAIPERVRIKHRLDGLDTVWQDVGSRREAFYTNLQPGSYRFRVIAANDDGVWNEADASLSFDVLPAWYQTIWSRVLAVLLVGGLGATAAALIQRGRHLRLQSSQKAQYEATLAERARIAQDLHDTLLQGFAGVTLQLKRAELALPDEPDVAAETIMEVQQLARASLREARERVWDMRDPQLPAHDLPTLLEVVARDRTLGSGIDVSLKTNGQRRRLPLVVEDAAFRIGREAVVNAVRHSSARRIEIEVDFGEKSLRLEVRDDGVGFAPQDAEAARRNGHFGLSGARERAARMGGVCNAYSRSEGGTIVSLELPLVDGAAR
jgi:signal transduction histidine kinase